MSKTQVRPSRDLRNNYADIVKSIKEHDYVVITNNGVGEIALVNLEDYEELVKFRHQRFIYEELQKAKAEANDPNVELRDASDVFDRIKQKIAGRGL